MSDGLVYHAGFPNAAEDSPSVSLSLDKLVFRHTASTFLWRLDEQGVDDFGWKGGSLVVVDRALNPREGDKVVAVIDESFVVRSYHNKQLVNLRGDIDVDAQSVSIWGVVTHVLMEYRT